MKFSLLAVALGAGLTLTGTAMADTSILAQKAKATGKLLLHLSFEGDYRDVSGNGLNAQAVGDAKAIGWTDGVNKSKAVTIDSDAYQGSYLIVPAAIGSKFDGAKASVSIWTMLGKTPASSWQALAERSNLWYIETEVNAGKWKDNSIVWRIYDPVAVGGGGAGQMRDDAAILVPNDKWLHIGWTYDGKTMVGFVDGKKVISKDYPEGLGPVAATPNPPPAGKGKNYDLALGTWQQRDDWFRGAIDDFQYFNDALTEAQMQELHDAMLAAPTAVDPQGKLAATWAEVKTAR